MTFASLYPDAAARARVFTSAGIGIEVRPPWMRRAPVRRPDVEWQLIHGPHLAAFDAGIYDDLEVA